MTPDGCPVAPLARRRSITQALEPLAPVRDTPRLCPDLADYEFPWDNPLPTTSEVENQKPHPCLHPVER